MLLLPPSPPKTQTDTGLCSLEMRCLRIQLSVLPFYERRCTHDGLRTVHTKFLVVGARMLEFRGWFLSPLLGKKKNLRRDTLKNEGIQHVLKRDKASATSSDIPVLKVMNILRLTRRAPGAILTTRQCPPPSPRPLFPSLDDLPFTLLSTTHSTCYHVPAQQNKNENILRRRPLSQNRFHQQKRFGFVFTCGRIASLLCGWCHSHLRHCCTEG